MRSPPEVCPNCGTLVPRHARACPGCGADEQTGWSERADAQRLDLPDDEFDYDEFVQQEFASTKAKSRPPIGWFWWTVAVLLLLSFLLWGFV